MRYALIAAAIGGVDAARFARRKQEVRAEKFIAGVPIFEYHLAYGGVEVGVEREREEREEHWIVMMKEDVDDFAVSGLCASSKSCTDMGHPSEGGVPFVEVLGSERELEAMLLGANGTVEFVEPDMIVSLPPDEDEEVAGEVMLDVESSASWGLGRIRLSSAPNRGQGAHVYIFDTGLRYSHTDFGSRAIPGVDITSGSLQTCRGDTSCARDRKGHGTHCGGTAAGSSYGVASRSKVYSVKTMNDNGNGRTSWNVKGLEWVASSGSKPAVVSMSLQAPGVSSSYKLAIDTAVSKGITVVVAAGNARTNACNYSPAFVPSAITVGSIRNNDARSGFSNYGSCVNIWAPGSAIVSASYSSNTGSVSKSGTSMACPHVAGAAAVELTSNSGLSPSGVLSKLLGRAARGAISDLKSGDTNRLLQMR